MEERIEEVLMKVRDEGRTQLLEDEAREILERMELPSPEGVIVDGLEDCKDAAESIGYPVVVKVVSEDIVHKDKVGGVVLDIRNEEGLSTAYERIKSRVNEKNPDCEIRGLYVSEMVQSKVELIVGGARDPEFGPVVMFGRGGTGVEDERDVVFRLAPLSVTEAMDMIKEFDHDSLSKGGTESVTEDIADMICKVGDAMDKIEDIESLDLNPVAVSDEGIKVLDVFISLADIP